MGKFTVNVEGVDHAFEIPQIDYPFAIALKKSCGVDLLHKDGILVGSGLFSETEKLVDATWFAVSPQVGAAGLTMHQFLMGLKGSVFDEISDAWMDAYLPFCRPSARGRQALGWKKIKAAIAETEQKLDVLMNDPTFGACHGDTPESSE